MVGEDSVEKVDQQEVTDVKTVMTFLTKAFTSLRIYLPNNPFVKKFHANLYESLAKFLDNYGKIALRINEFELLYKDTVVYRNTDRSGSIAFILHKDGVREISFLKDVDSDEVFDFLNILKKNADLPDEESDIVGSLWSRDFQYIKYTAVEDIVETRSLGMEPIEMEPEEKVVDSNINAKKILASQKVNDNIPVFDTYTDLLLLEDKEMHDIENLISTQLEIKPGLALVKILFNLLKLESNHKEFAQIVQFSAELLQRFIDGCKFTYALQILKEAKIFFHSTEDLPLKNKEKISNFLRIAEETDTIEKLAARINEVQDEDEMKSALQYLGLVEKKTMPLICDLLFKVSDVKTKNYLLNLIEILGEENPATIRKFLSDERADLVMELIPLVIKIDKTKSIKYLERFIKHNEEKVRLRVISSLKTLKGTEANRLFVKFLDDKSERVRLSAAENLQYSDDKSVIQKVCNIVENKDFLNKETAEQLVLINFLGKSKSNSAVSTLRKILNIGGLFSGSKNDAIRIASAHALGEIGSKTAMEALKKGSMIRRKKISKVCKTLLQKTGEIE